MEELIILEIVIENNKAVKCFNLKSNGQNIAIAGSTGQGKTTAASALWNIFTKGKDTVTHGEKSGTVRVKLGEEGSDNYVIAERKTTASGKSTFVLQRVRGGKKMEMTMDDFKSMISSLSINPHKIAGMKPTERIKTLMAAAKCDIDLDALDAEISEAEQERLLANRSAKASMPVMVPEKTEPISVSELITERDKINEENKKIEEGVRRHDDNCARHDDIQDEIKELQRKMEALNEERGLLIKKIETGSKWLEENPPQDTVELDNKIATAEETNAKASVYEQAVKDQAHHEELLDVAKKADEMVKTLRAQKKEALDNVQWPLDGIAIEDGEITYNGSLLENLGESEKMLVCAALALEDIRKHEVRVVRMDGVESMSIDDFNALTELFNGLGVQVISTRVSRDGSAEPGEIVITDGVYNKKEEE